jgi:hypothetical protein
MATAVGHSIGHEPQYAGSPFEDYLPGGGHRQRVHRLSSLPTGVIRSLIQLRGEFFPVQYQADLQKKNPTGQAPGEVAYSPL